MNPSSPFTWPQGCLSAISVTFDDGLRSQLEIAIPRLEDRGLRGTFYLNPRGGDWQGHLAAWQPAQGAGHEMGNHTISSPNTLSPHAPRVNR